MAFCFKPLNNGIDGKQKNQQSGETNDGAGHDGSSDGLTLALDLALLILGMETGSIEVSPVL